MRLVRAGKLTEPLRADSPAYPRVAPAKKSSLLRIVFDLVFNTAFVVGDFVVLVREERYARGAAYAPPLPIQQPVQSPEAGEPKSILSSD